MKLTSTAAAVVATLAVFSNPSDARLRGRHLYTDNALSHRRLGFWTGASYTPRYDELFGGPGFSPKYDEDADYEDADYNYGAMRRLRKYGDYGGYFCNGASCHYTNPGLKRECEYGRAGNYWSYYSKDQCM